eukprot:m.80771 g.80771  ORF g.80771 m.80771 type:complete len:74 (-) comp10932_c0_seq3:2372-2593(-)
MGQLTWWRWGADAGDTTDNQDTFLPTTTTPSTTAFVNRPRSKSCIGWTTWTSRAQFCTLVERRSIIVVQIKRM